MTTLANDMHLILASSIRVARHLTTAGDLIAMWPSLKTKALESPPTLTDFERRLFFDLPDEDMEAANLKAATSLSRDQLIEKAISARENLTTEEVVLLKNRFWTPRIEAEIVGVVRALSGTSKAVIEEFYTARALGKEDAAFIIGTREHWRRSQASENVQLEVAAKAALPYAKEWIQQFYQTKKLHWGFVCFCDPFVQQLEPGKIELLKERMEEFFRHALMYNGSADIIDKKWTLLHVDAPKRAFAPGPATEPATEDYQGGAVFREAFREILKDPQRYQNAEGVAFRGLYAWRLKNDIATSGLLRNTFLVIDRTCMNSILTDTYFPLFDDMRILAFEADFPVPGRQYIEGYKGFTWVRLDQLVYNFYELRSMKADQIGMDEIWKSGQASHHQAFVSMDSVEASSWTTSNSMRGFSQESVLGSRWYAMKDARLQADSQK